MPAQISDPPVLFIADGLQTTELLAKAQLDVPQVAEIHIEKPQEQDPLIDGGYRAWSTVIGAWFTVFCTFGYSNAFGVYQDFYTRTGSHSASKISWIGSTQLFFVVAMGFPAGKLVDLGYFKPAVVVGSLLYVFSLFMLSIAHPDQYYQIFLSQGLGMGIGGGLLYVPAMTIQAHHWRKRRALAMGIVASGTSSGGIVFPIMLNKLFQSSLGFAWAVRISAFVVLFMLGVGCILMHSRITPSTRSPSALTPSIKSLFTDVPYMFANIGYLLVSWGLYFPYFYLQLYAVVHGVDLNLAFYTIAIMNAASIPGRTLPSLLADKFGASNVLIPTCFGSGVLLMAMLGVKTAPVTIVFAILYGFISGGFFSLLPSSIAGFSHGPSEFGFRMGVSFLVSAFGPLTGTPIDGALLQSNYLWYKPIIFSAVTVFGGTFFLAVGRTLLAKRKGTQLV